MQAIAYLTTILLDNLQQFCCNDIHKIRNLQWRWVLRTLYSISGCSWFKTLPRFWHS